MQGAPWGLRIRECEFSLFTGSVRKTGTHICYESIFMQFIHIYSMFVLYINIYIFIFIQFINLLFVCTCISTNG